MKHTSPRIRTLLRQADKVATSGKRMAAEKLYRQIIEESPETALAWVGLAQVIRDPAEQEDALEKALALDSSNMKAKIGLTALRNGQSVSEALQPDLEEDSENGVSVRPNQDEQEQVTKNDSRPDSVQKPARFSKAEPVPVQQATADLIHEEHPAAVVNTDEALTCSNHPNRRTNLRCNKCGKPVCSKCVRPTPVGYRCKECIREHEGSFFNATWLEYLIAAAVAFPLGLISGFIAGYLSWLVIFFAAFAGSLIGRIVFQAVRRRRGRWMPHLVASAVIVGGLIPAFSSILALFFGGASFAMINLLFIGIYVVVATGAAFYQMK
jgi:hypothetical protein